MTKRKERDTSEPSLKCAKVTESTPKSSKDSFWLKTIEVFLGLDRDGSQIDYLHQICGVRKDVVSGLRYALTFKKKLDHPKKVDAKYYKPLTEEGLTIGEEISTVFIPKKVQGESVPQNLQAAKSFFLQKEDVICVYAGSLISYADHNNDYKVFKAFKIKSIESGQDQAKSAEESAVSEPMSDVPGADVESVAGHIERREAPSLSSDDLPRGESTMPRIESLTQVPGLNALVSAADVLGGSSGIGALVSAAEFLNLPVQPAYNIDSLVWDWDSCRPAGEESEMVAINTSEI